MILDEIIAFKQAEVARHKELFPLAELEKKVVFKKRRGFKESLEKEGVSLIAEVKRASPSKGLLCRDFDPAGIAACYHQNGAAAVSVLTDERFFQGSLAHLEQVGAAVPLPLLRKDFIIDAYQVWESCLFGADAVLLIAAVLPRRELVSLLRLARELELDVLVEAHTRRELEMSLEAGAVVVGINNRDLRTFRTDLNTTLELAELVPDTCLLVSESGISSAADIKLLAQAGVDAVLVGEALVTSADMAQKTREIAGRL
ncbi:MAG: indole-3-glycerol phosphate synthase TrpC [Peptococcaceae bacterium]|jgi:indole-3-glycerol phosphate synthase|nr:indole-3-glycerol phosphate synthase TrpC [Peptococcaceae bacterium]MDH7525605.1 indole-3-glycerol phosphate synthase TrpC [Peptococcaceae bacterium]